MLKVSPWKGVIRFGKKGKLAPRYVGPFEILERIGPVAYRLRLPEELSGVHDTFHVSNLKKCLADASLHVPLDEIKVDKTLRFVEEPVEIMDRDVKRLKRSKISLVKVRWNSKRGPEFTWERKDYMKSKYPRLFVEQAGELHENIEVREILFSYCYAFSVSLLLTPLCCDDIHDVTPRVSALAGCDRLCHDSVAFTTGCKRIKNSKRCNSKIRIPIAMWPCRVEEKMTLKEVDGQTVEEIETKIIAKDGTITRVPGKFQDYETFEEEPFAPHRLPQLKGNMNGWLIEDEEEVKRNEVDSNLESTASSKPVWRKTTKAAHDRASRNCPYCSK
ncbi:hypothetical protein Tco_1368966 [Tanacetum coccineum]